MGKSLDLTNQRFGKLVALHKTNKRDSSGCVFWLCQCDCGNKKEVRGSELKRGNVISCGCASKERFKNIGLNKKIDLTGQRFGRLVVLKDSGIRKHESIYWTCKCDCGTIKDIDGIWLRNKKIQSCGCAKMSIGESIIKNILQEYQIPFETQKTFESCRFPESKRLAFFDFYVDNTYIIEYDGEQHFNARDIGWSNIECVKNTQYRDFFKNNWCKNNNIPIIRIPYVHLKMLCIEDLLLETSQYII